MKTEIYFIYQSRRYYPRLYKQIILDYGIKVGLERSDMLFTSDNGFPNGVKRETVFDLFSLSNLFICLSFSESFGLTVIEAASRGNYIVLNEAMSALNEIGKNIGTYFMRWDARNFGFDTYEDYHPSEGIYLIDHAQKIVGNIVGSAQGILFATLLYYQEYRFYQCEENPTGFPLYFLVAKNGCYLYIIKTALYTCELGYTLSKCNYNNCKDCCHEKPCEGDSCSHLMESVSLEQAARSYILSAEGEKLEKVIASSDNRQYR